MKSHISHVFRLGLLLIMAASTWACQDVIELDVPEKDPELVVQGSITTQDTQWVKLSFSTPYFEKGTLPPATQAQVRIEGGAGEVISLSELQAQPGVYWALAAGVEGDSYILDVVLADGTHYRSDPEPLMPVSEINGLGYYKEEADDDEADYYYGLLLSATEPQDTRDFYRWKIFINDTLWSNPEDLAFARDDFVNEDVVGVEIYYGELQVGDTLRVEQLSITESYYEFLNLVFQQTAFRGGLFDTPPAAIPGNVYRVDDPAKRAFGYFNASDVSVKGIRIED